MILPVKHDTINGEVGVSRLVDPKERQLLDDLRDRLVHEEAYFSPGLAGRPKFRSFIASFPLPSGRIAVTWIYVDVEVLREIVCFTTIVVPPNQANPFTVANGILSGHFRRDLRSAIKGNRFEVDADRSVVGVPLIESKKRQLPPHNINQLPYLPESTLLAPIDGEFEPFVTFKPGETLPSRDLIPQLSAGFEDRKASHNLHPNGDSLKPADVLHRRAIESQVSSETPDTAGYSILRDRPPTRISKNTNNSRELAERKVATPCIAVSSGKRSVVAGSRNRYSLVLLFVGLISLFFSSFIIVTGIPYRWQAQGKLTATPPQDPATPGEFQNTPSQAGVQVSQPEVDSNHPDFILLKATQFEDKHTVVPVEEPVWILRGVLNSNGGWAKEKIFSHTFQDPSIRRGGQPVFMMSESRNAHRTPSIFADDSIDKSVGETFIVLAKLDHTEKDEYATIDNGQHSVKGPARWWMTQFVRVYSPDFPFSDSRDLSVWEDFRRNLMGWPTGKFENLEIFLIERHNGDGELLFHAKNDSLYLLQGPLELPLSTAPINIYLRIEKRDHLHAGRVGLSLENLMRLTVSWEGEIELNLDQVPRHAHLITKTIGDFSDRTVELEISFNDGQLICQANHEVIYNGPLPEFEAELPPITRLSLVAQGPGSSAFRLLLVNPSKRQEEDQKGGVLLRRGASSGQVRPHDLGHDRVAADGAARTDITSRPP